MSEIPIRETRSSSKSPAVTLESGLACDKGEIVVVTVLGYD